MDSDSVLEALDKLKDWAIERMLKSGEAPDGEAGDKPPDEHMEGEKEPAAAEIEIEAMPMDEAGDCDDDEEEDMPKNTVLARHFVGGALPKKPSGKVPVSRR